MGVREGGLHAGEGPRMLSAPPMSIARSSYATASLLLTLVACNIAESEEETLDLDTRPLFYSAAEPFVSGSRALQGSRACLAISGVHVGDQWWIDSPFDRCYAVTLDGAAVEDGACVTLDVPGEIVYDFTPLATCPIDQIVDLIVPDRYRLQVVGPDGLRGRLEWYEENQAEIWLSPGPRGSFPSDWVPPADAPLQLVPDVQVPFSVIVVDASGERAAWDLEQGRVLESRNGGAARELTSIPDYAGYFPVSISEGDRSTLSLALPGVELPVAEVVATPADAAASLEVVVGYWPQEDPAQWTNPVGARAIVRDADGRAILGAPVRWTLIEGHLVTGPIDDELGTPPEYLAISDDCEPPPAAPQPRRARLRAELGELVHEIELEWTALPEDEPRDEPFEPNPECQRGGEASELEDRGCGCTASGGSQGGAWLAWGMVMLGIAARRRRSRGR